ncbi:MAG: cytidine deaminase [Ruthenibacterium sp.]
MEYNQVYADLIEKATQARKFSYAPYSNFMVGAALLTKSGKIFTGCNVESVSYTPTTCAERVAILKAVSEGERTFEAIAVIGGPADGIKKTDIAAGPCGVCRQLIYEFGTDIKVIVANSVDDYYVKTISELFPLGFGPENLIAK